MTDRFSYRSRSPEPPDPVKPKPDCLRCPWHRPIEGEARLISCTHPSTRDIAGSQEAHLAELTGYLGPIGVGALGIRFAATGIILGEGHWPFRFSPQWLRSCSAAPPPRGTQLD